MEADQKAQRATTSSTAEKGTVYEDMSTSSLITAPMTMMQTSQLSSAPLMQESCLELAGPSSRLETCLSLEEDMSNVKEHSPKSADRDLDREEDREDASISRKNRQP